MTRKAACAAVMRFFQTDRRLAKVEGKSRSGRCYLIGHEFAAEPGVPGRRYVLARARSWEDCLAQLMPRARA